MSTFKSIRDALGMTQEALGRELGVTQGNVGHYERQRQTVPPDIARKLIETARARGLELTYDHVYGDAELPERVVDTKAAA